MWDRWGAQSGKVSLSLRKIEVFEGPGDPHGPPGRGLRPSRDQVWATKSTLGMRERRFRALKRRFWATSGAQATILGNFGCQNLTQWTIFDQFWERKSDLSACIRYKSYDFMLRVEMCFEKRADVRSDRSLAFFFSGSAAVAAGQSIRRPREERGLGVGVTNPTRCSNGWLSRVGVSRVEKTRIEGGG